MSDPTEILRLAEGAQRLLNDESATTAVRELMEEIKSEWVNTRPEDKEGREDLWRLGRSMQLFVTKLQAMRDRGKVEVHRSEQARKSAAAAIH